MIISLSETSKSFKDHINYDEIIYIINTADVFDTGKEEEMNILMQTLINAGVKKIIIDMYRLEFIDSRGISVIINAAKTIRKNNGDLVLVNIPERVNTIFKPINLQRFIKMFESASQGIKYLKVV